MNVNQTGKLAAALVAGIVTVILLGCSSKAVDDPIVAKAGDRDITASLFAAYTQQVAKGPPEKLDQAYRERLLQRLVQLTMAAEREVARADRNTVAAAELQRLEFYAKAGATRAAVYAPPTPVELQRAYDAFVSSQPPAEFHVAHILVPTENMALGVIRKLSGGAKFATLAKAESVDDSRDRGGDLGWIHPGKLPAAFMDAASKLKPGQHTVQPVKTPYGWHVIRLLDIRSAAVPPLANVQAQLVVNLQQQKYEAFLRRQ